MKKTFWLCGEYKEGRLSKIIWEFIGIYDSKRKALKACRHERYFIAPVILNDIAPSETQSFPNCEYPLRLK
jgi:hypothetical protein